MSADRQSPLANFADVEGKHHNAETLIAFLTRFQSHSAWSLAAIREPLDAGGTAQTDFEFLKADAWRDDKLRRFLTSHDQWNIYFEVNPPRRRPKHGRTSKADIDFLLGTYVDVDLKDTHKDLDWTDPDAVAAAKAEVLARIDAFTPSPAIVIFTGGGYQAIWALAEPWVVKGDKALMRPIELRNQFLITQLGGDPGPKSAAQLFRAPGSINRLSQTKIEAGRQPVRAQLIRYDERRIVISDIPTLAENPTSQRSGETWRPEAGHFVSSGAAGTDLAEAADALRYVDADPFENYVPIGMALHDHFGEAGLDLWRAWARTSSKFSEADLLARWRSFTRGGGITIAKLFHLAKQRGWVRSQMREQRFTVSEEPLDPVKDITADAERDDTDIIVVDTMQEAEQLIAAELALDVELRDDPFGRFAFDHGLRLIILLETPPGLGKSVSILKRIKARALANSAFRAVVATPRVDLSQELDDKYLAPINGLSTLVYRGRDQVMPPPDGRPLCENPEAVRLANGLGLPIKPGVCEGKQPEEPVRKTLRKHNKEGRRVKPAIDSCQFRHGCLWFSQLNQDRQVTLLTHQMLYHGGDGIPEPGLVFIDEGFVEAGLSSVVRVPLSKIGYVDGRAPVNRPVAVVRHRPPGSGPATAADVEIDVAGELPNIEYRVQEKLRQLIERRGEQGRYGGFTRAELNAAELSASQWRGARVAAFKRAEDMPILRPGMPLSAVARAAGRWAGKLSPRQWAEVYGVFGRFMGDGGPAPVGEEPDEEPDDHSDSEPLSPEEVSGEVVLRGPDPVEKIEEPTLEIGRLSPISRHYQATRVIADATPTPGLSGLAFGGTDRFNWQRRMHIRVRMPPLEHVRFRQYFGAPVSTTRLIKAKGSRRNQRLIHQFVVEQAKRFEGAVLVVCQKAVEEALVEFGLPANVVTDHFNNITGKDVYGKARAVIVIGATLPQSEKLEAMVGRMTGVQPARPARKRNGIGAWYGEPVERAIPLRGGGYVKVMVPRHPDPLVEEARWKACEGEIEQVIGRLRLSRRTAEDPAEVIIVGDYAIRGVVLDEAVAWKDRDTLPAIFAAMLDEAGFIPLTPAHAVRRFPKLFKTKAKGGAAEVEAARIKAAKMAFHRAFAEGRECEGEEGNKKLQKKEGSKREGPLKIFVTLLPLLPLAYRIPGPGQKWRQAVVLPEAMDDFQAWLVEAFGESVEINFWPDLEPLERRALLGHLSIKEVIAYLGSYELAEQTRKAKWAAAARGGPWSL